MNYRYPIHKPWCKGVSHDGECPPADSPLFRDGDEFVETMLELFAVVRACCDGYGEQVPHLGMHDASKRLYRMGYRRVADPELATCRHCGAPNVVTAQSVCIKCVGKPAHPATPRSEPNET
jgi:hypothetical protein